MKLGPGVCGVEIEFGRAYGTHEVLSGTISQDFVLGYSRLVPTGLASSIARVAGSQFAVSAKIIQRNSIVLP